MKVISVSEPLPLPLWHLQLIPLVMMRSDAIGSEHEKVVNAYLFTLGHTTARSHTLCPHNIPVSH